MQKENPLDVLRNSGKRPGLEIWVVRTAKPPERQFSHLFSVTHPDFEPEHEAFAVSRRKHGIFYNEDLYIVLKTHEDKKRRDIHFWIGNDFKDIPPLWVDHFEDLDLTWKANQHFEFQGYECQLFESYFHDLQPAIRYKTGKTPEPHSDKSHGRTRFYQLEGLDKLHYRVCEIPFNIELMTKEGCFILDTDYNTRAYVSDRVPKNERHQSVIVANSIRELDHEGNGEVEIVDLATFYNEKNRESLVESVKPVDIAKDPLPEIDYEQPDEDPTDPIIQMNMISFVYDDEVVNSYPPRFRYVPKPREIVKVNTDTMLVRFKKSFVNKLRRLFGMKVVKEIEYEVPDLSEVFHKTAVMKPLKQELLNSKKCYIVQGTSGKGLFLWVGAESDKALRAEVTECLRLEVRRCEPYIELDPFKAPENPETYTKKEELKKPSWTHIQKVIGGEEPLKFKRYFQDWEQ